MSKLFEQTGRPTSKLFEQTGRPYGVWGVPRPLQVSAYRDAQEIWVPGSMLPDTHPFRDGSPARALQSHLWRKISSAQGMVEGCFLVHFSINYHGGLQGFE